MVTAILVLVALLILVAMVFMVVQAVRGDFLATVWVCCGGFEGCAKLLGELVTAIVDGLSS